MKDYLLNIEERMEKTIVALKNELITIRAGRAHPGLLERIMVEYYGASTPLNQISNISCPDARSMVIQPWDKTAIKAIEKAILVSDLGLNPSNDGSIIRLVIPPLTEQRRKDLTKMVDRKGEEAKIALRNIRRDANDEARRMEKEKMFSEDEMHLAFDECQKVTDRFVKEVDEVIELKNKDIMEV